MHHYKVFLGQLISQAKNSFTLGVLTLVSSRLLYILMLAFKNGSYHLLIIHGASKFLILMIQFGRSEIGLQDGVTACFPLVESLRFFPNVLSSMSLYSLSTCYDYSVHVEIIYPFFKGCFCLLLWILIVVGDLLLVFLVQEGGFGIESFYDLVIGF